jgi:membrane fusion protein
MSAAEYIEQTRSPKTWSDQPHPASEPEPLVQRAQAARLTTTIDIRQNRTATLVTLLFAGAIVATFAALWFGHFSQTEPVRGIVSVAGGVARLDAPRAGVIKDILVQQGQFVEVGQPIYAIRVNNVGSTGSESAVETQLRTLEKTRANLIGEIDRAKAFLARGQDTQASIAADQVSLMSALDAEEKNLKAASTKAKAEADKVRGLVKEGYATRDVLNNLERTSFEFERQLIDARMKRVEYQRQYTDKQREVDAQYADKQSQKTNADIQLQATEAQIADLRTEAGIVVQAQSSGFVLSITGKVGDSINVGQFVAAIGDPNAETLVEIDAPAQSVGLIKVGDAAILKYDAFPFKTFGVQHGVITAISASPIKGPDIQGAAGADQRPPEQRQSLYRVEIRPDSNEIEAYGQKQKLKIGSTLTADLIVERRRLIDWVLDPIRALRGRT